MKRIQTTYFILIAFLVSTITIAQPEPEEPSQTNYISNRTVNLMDNPNDYTGSPYYKEEFLGGNVIFKGTTIATNEILRYNVSKEEFEIKDLNNPGGKIVKTVFRNEDISIEIGDESFEYISSEKNRLRGYFIPLVKGDQNSLYKKIKKEFIASQRAVNSMASDIAAMYKEQELFYLVDDKGTYKELPSSKKKRINAFGKNKKAVKEYAKKNKLNIKKEEDLIKIVTFSNSL